MKKELNKVAQAANKLIEQLLLKEKMTITENALYQASKELFRLCASHPDYEPKNPPFFIIEETEISEEEKAIRASKANQMMRTAFLELINISNLKKGEIAKLLQINAPHLSAILGGTKQVQIQYIYILAERMNLVLNIDLRKYHIDFQENEIC